VTNLEALSEFLTARPSVDPVLAALARSLAAEIDAQSPGMASLAKEYRATLERLRSDDAGGTSALDDLFAEVGD
jgi:hypothetical protein